MQFDLDSPALCQSIRTFPPEIIQTTLRLDGIIWFVVAKTVVWIELTSPWEDNMDYWHDQNAIIYSDLRYEIEAKGWKVHALYVEVGTRGHICPCLPPLPAHA